MLTKYLESGGIDLDKYRVGISQSWSDKEEVWMR